MKSGAELKAEGNLLYQHGRYEEARVLYSTAIDHFSSSKSLPASQVPQTLLSQLFSNRAQTFIQQRDFVFAIQGALSHNTIRILWIPVV